jgi:hypothetical protein
MIENIFLGFVLETGIFEEKIYDRCSAKPCESDLADMIYLYI